MSLASRLARNPCDARRAARLGVERKSRGCARLAPFENRGLLFRGPHFSKNLAPGWPQERRLATWSTCTIPPFCLFRRILSAREILREVEWPVWRLIPDHLSASSPSSFETDKTRCPFQ